MAGKDKKVQWSNKVLTSFQGMVAEIVTEPDLQVVLQNAAERVVELVEADIVTIHIYDPSTGRVRAAAGIGLIDDEAFRQHVAGRGKAALLVVDRGEPVVAEDVSVSELAGPFAAREQVKSAAGFPLKTGDEVMGVLFVSYHETHRFQPGEIETIISLGNLVSIAINVASLYEKERVRASTIQQINDIGRSLIAVRGVEVLDRIVEGARSVLEADVVVLYEYQEAIANVVIPPIITGDLGYPKVLSEISSRRPHRESAVFKVLERQEPFYAAKADQDWGRFIEGWVHEGSFLDREDIVSSAAIPLVVDEKPVGVLFVNYRTYHAFPEEERRVIEFFAAQAAIAIQNARFFQRERALREEAAALRDVSRAISSDLELKAVGKAILKELAKEIAYTKASAQLIHGDERKLIAYEGYPAAAVDEWLLRPVSKDRLVNRIVKSKRPLILSHPAKDPAWGPRPGTQDVKSWVGVPLVYEDEVIAFLTIDHTEAGFYSRDQEGMFAAFADRAVIDIRNASLFDIARRRIRDLEIVNDVVKAINTQLDTREILRTIVSQIAHRLDCAYCALFLKQGEQRSPSPEMIYDAQMEQLAELPSGLAGDLARRVFQHRQSVLVHDPKEDPQLSDVAKEGDERRSMLGVPVIVDGQVIGVIVADQKEYSWFSETDRQLVDTLAQQASSAIGRAKGLDLLHNIGNQIIRRPQINVKEMLERIVSGAIQLTGAETGIIFLISQDGKSIVGSFWYPPDFDYPPPRMEGEGGITRQIIATGEIVSFSDICQTDDVNPLMHERVQSMIGVPLKLEQKVIGVLYLNYHNYHEFTATEESMLSTVASQAAIAIRNAQLFEESRRQADELSLLHQVSSGLRTLNLDELLSFIVQGAMRLTQTESGYIYLLNDAGTRIATSVAYPPDAPYPKSRPRKKGLTRHVVKTGEPVFISDTSQDERVHPAIVAQGIQSFLGQPLKVANRVLGVLYLNDQSLRTFTPAERSLIQALADQAAAAIYNASLFEESLRLSEGHRTLNSVGTKLMGMREEKEILEHVARAAADTLFGDQADTSAYTHCTVFRKQEDKLVVQTSQGNRDWSMLEGRCFEAGQGIAGWVAKTGRPELVHDSFRKKHFQKDWSAPQPDPRSLVVVPILLDDGVYGVISAEHDQIGAFDEHDRRLLETLASQAGQALQNVRLLETRRRLETQLNQVVQEQDLDKVLDRIVEGIAEILGSATSPTINLYNEEMQKFTRCHGCGPLKKALEVPPRPVGTGMHVVETGEPLYLPDVLHLLDGRPMVRPEFIKMGIRSFAAIPLKRQEHILGVLFVNSQAPLSFSAETRRVLELFAGQAAIAIHISQDLERKIKELEVLTEIGRTVSNLGIDQILDLVYAETSEIVDLGDAQVQIALYDKEQDEVGFPLAVEQNNGEIIDIVRDGIREKFLFNADLELQQELDQGILPESLRPQFSQHGISLGNDPAIETELDSGKWVIRDQEQDRTYIIRKGRGLAVPEKQEPNGQDEKLIVYEIGQAVKQFQPRPLGSRFGLTEYVLDVKRPVLLREEFRQTGDPAQDGSADSFVLDLPLDGDQDEEAEIASVRVWRRFGKLDRPTNSWLGVPMIVQDRVIGIISIQSLGEEPPVDQGQLRVLEVVANQAAVAIENARLYVEQHETIQALEEAQDKIRQLERVRIMSNMAADFVHRVSNMAGTIPLRLQRIDEIVDQEFPNAKQVLAPYLDGIRTDTEELLAASQRLRDPAQRTPAYESVDVSSLVSGLVRELRLRTPRSVEVNYEKLTPDLPPVHAIKIELEDAIRDVLTNAAEATINQEGRIEVSTAYDKTRRGWIDLEVKDEGYGIPEEVLPHVFSLFYTTKETGIGYGLWRAKNAIEAFGGEITLDSKVGEGTVVHIRLPAAKE